MGRWKKTATDQINENIPRINLIFTTRLLGGGAVLIDLKPQKQKLMI